MRTSGAVTESKLTVAVFIIALGCLVLLAGGPSQFLETVERALEAAAGAVYHVYRSVRG
jgi:hypothetical protein